MKEETKNKINLLESRFSEVRRIGELAKDISIERSKLAQQVARTRWVGTGKGRNGVERIEQTAVVL